jgi:hypothetical protein
MAAVLSCGPRAALSHESAAALWQIRPRAAKRGEAKDESVHVTVPSHVARRRPGIILHRRQTFASEETTRCNNIPVTTPICTLIDLATILGRAQLERAVNEADRLNLTDPEALRVALDRVARRPGVGVLRDLLEKPTFALTDSELERRFLPIAHKAGLHPPQTGRIVNGFKVDFYWPDLDLVVETDGLRYHRTAAQQATDRIRDSIHVSMGLVSLRFTHAQVRYDPEFVITTLKKVAANRTKRS